MRVISETGVEEMSGTTTPVSEEALRKNACTPIVPKRMFYDNPEG